ncbi:hypothetical protein ACJZ2D_004116 [Fusarium nematophilum]
MIVQIYLTLDNERGRKVEQTVSLYGILSAEYTTLTPIWQSHSDELGSTDQLATKSGETTLAAAYCTAHSESFSVLVVLESLPAPISCIRM